MNAARGRKWAVATAVAGTVFIAVGAFWLSFTSLADLAVRSGIDARQAWAWPLIVDGIIVTATVAAVALAGDSAAWYPWTLLIGGATVSVTANALHAVVAADADVPAVLAAAVASVPPIVLLAITHLTVILTRHDQRTDPDRPAIVKISPHARASVMRRPGSPAAVDAAPGLEPENPSRVTPRTPFSSSDGDDRRVRARSLRDQGWPNRAIAREFSVHPSTVGRWLARTDQPAPVSGAPKATA